MARASLGIVLGLAALQLSACAKVLLGEYGEQACQDHKDNDGDGRKDCQDPDCFGTEACRKSGAATDLSRFDAGSHDAGRIQSFDSGPMDAGKVRDASIVPETSPPFIPEAAVDDDGGGIADGGPACMPACAVGEVCNAGRCGPAGGMYILSIRSAMAPNFASDGTCYDLDCVHPPDATHQPCWCVVDPYVRAFVVHNGADTQGHQTPTATSTPAAYYVGLPDASWPITLAAGDSIRFEVWDASDSGSDTELYTCVPDLTNVPGTISCSYLGMDANAFVRFTVTADLDIATP
jgi:hypothetical protein